MCTCSSSSISKQIKVLIAICFVFIVGTGCANNVHDSFAMWQGYVITLPENATPADQKWGKYLYNHLLKRASEAKYVAYASGPADYYKLQIVIDSSMKSDYKVICGKGSVTMKVKNEKDVVWMLYQVMKKIGDEDARISSDDLPPAMLTMNDTTAMLPFEYREAYFEPNTVVDDSPIFGMNNVSSDWGLWGHHLPTAIGKDAPSTVYATVDGEKYEDQYCFSSEDTYKRIESYIIDNFGDGHKQSYRFSIFPNDDDCVCMCAQCKAAGNTPKNATPAVTKLILRLAKRFPLHKFYTSCYLSTKTPPTTEFPDNVGVVISAMDFPLKVGGTKNAGKFTDLVEQWQKVTPHIYVWDYVNNFDDYFTPFPSLYVMQERLKYYCDLGVKGVFLNGSGYSYSSFGDMQNYVLAALMINPYWNVDELVARYFNQYFPTTAEMLTDYCLKLEKAAQTNKASLNLYGGVYDAIGEYLDTDEFANFYDEIGKSLKSAKGDEHTRLSKFYLALTYTRLELARIAATGDDGCAVKNGISVKIKPEVSEMVNHLMDYKGFEDMSSFCEKEGDLMGDYINGWKTIIDTPQLPNLILSQKVTALSKLDEGYENLEMLTDGIHGIAANYHSGWIISSLNPQLILSVPVASAQNAHSITLSFLHSPHFHIFAPKSVEVIKNNSESVVLKVPEPIGDKPQELVTVSGSINLSGAKSLTVKITRQDGKRKNIACDEIQLNP
jgi:hypothetical protein